jgi:predicted Zn-dependent protease
MTARTVKKLWIYSLLMGLLILAGFGACLENASTRQARLVRQARNYLARSNTKTALLCLRRALNYNTNCVDACRAMAELTEKLGTPAALLWRSRVVELDPKSVPDRFALAQTALVCRDYFSATNALEGVSQAARSTPEYHNLAGSVAAAMRRLAEAGEHFSEAARLEPTNPIPRLNLAVVRLQGTNAQDLALGRIALRGLRADPVVRCQALRELAADSLHCGEAEHALAFSNDLLQQTNALFSDRLLRLDVLRATRSRGFAAALASAQKEAASDPRNLFAFVTWEEGRAGPAGALAWLQRLPPERQTNPPAALLTADCQAALQQWRPLEMSLERQQWGELDFVRHAFKSLALRRQGLASSADNAWGNAINATGARKERLVMLLRLASAWNWAAETEELLWAIIHKHPGERWAAVALSRNLLREGRTRALMGLYGEQSRLSPEDLSARNNLAMTALLLDARELRPQELAHEVYRKAPANPAYASTYAYSLYLQNQSAQALKVFERLKPGELEQPSVALYYAIVLQATGNGERARKYLDIAAGLKLLPEEQKLLVEARGRGKEEV